MSKKKSQAPGQNDSAAMAFVRRHKMHFFGGICMVGDLLLAHRGAFNHDANIKCSGIEMTAGATSAWVGGPKLLTATALTSAGIENIISGVKDVGVTGLTLQTGLQIGFGIGWTIAPVAMFYGHEVLETLKHSSPFLRMRDIIFSEPNEFAEASPFARLAKNLTQEQVGATIYNGVATVIGVEGAATLAQGLAKHNLHTVHDALIGLSISALFLGGNAVASLSQAPIAEAKPAKVRREAPGLKILGLKG